MANLMGIKGLSPGILSIDQEEAVGMSFSSSLKVDTGCHGRLLGSCGPPPPFIGQRQSDRIVVLQFKGIPRV